MQTIDNQAFNKKVTKVTLLLRFCKSVTVHSKKKYYYVHTYIYNTFLVKSSVTL
jgi:hypothetical protein